MNTELSISTNTTTWFPHPINKGRCTLRITFPTGVTGTAKVVTSSDKSDSEKTGAVFQSDFTTQVSFDGGGTYLSYYVDISGEKYFGIETTSISGGSITAEIVSINR
jgi:hypothetical protein